jgi:hypothetical protein
MDTERVAFIKHGSREILLINFSDCRPHEVFPVIDQAKKAIRTRPESTVLTLTDVTNTRFDDKVSAELKAFTAHNKPYVKAAAVVGVTGLKKIILEAVMLFSKRKFHAFETVEHAKNWLVTN